MSLSSEQQDIESIVGRLLDNLLWSLPSQHTADTYAARRQIGMLRSTFIDDLNDNIFGDELLSCFSAVKEVGANLVGLARIRQRLVDEKPKGPIASAIVQTSIFYCLSTESRIISEKEFKSRDDVEVEMSKMAIAFDQAKEMAADEMISECYQSIVQLASSLMVHLANEARPLPRMIAIKLSTNLPALTASQFIYHDASRYDELVDENHIVHPAFCPMNLRGLSA